MGVPDSINNLLSGDQDGILSLARLLAEAFGLGIIAYLCYDSSSSSDVIPQEKAAGEVLYLDLSAEEEEKEAAKTTDQSTETTEVMEEEREIHKFSESVASKVIQDCLNQDVNRDYSNRVAELEREVTQLRQTLESSDARSKQAKLDLARERSRSEMLLRELRNQDLIWGLRTAQTEEAAAAAAGETAAAAAAAEAQREAFQK